jgi:hypothetical protein
MGRQLDIQILMASLNMKQKEFKAYGNKQVSS